MPKLRHIALHTPDPEATAEFYKRVFEMKEVGKVNSPIAEGYYLSDGDLNVAILKFKDPAAADRHDGLGPNVMGIHHMGFWVEDAETARKRLLEAGAEPRGDIAPAGTSFFEEKWKGPDGVMIDISEHGWGGARPITADEPAAARA
jgi:catechol 2,3-dioxygenase-like lactoylglutathione lyase family enzyme